MDFEFNELFLLFENNKNFEIKNKFRNYFVSVIEKFDFKQK